MLVDRSDAMLVLRTTNEYIYNNKIHLCNAPIKVDTLNPRSVREVLRNDDANAVKDVSVLFLSMWKRVVLYLCSRASSLIVRSKGNRSSSSRDSWTPGRKSTCYSRDTTRRQLV